MTTSKLLVLTICAYRKPSMDEAEFHRYLTEVHAPWLKDLLSRHGVVRYTMVSPWRIILWYGWKLLIACPDTQHISYTSIVGADS